MEFKHYILFKHKTFSLTLVLSGSGLLSVDRMIHHSMHASFVLFLRLCSLHFENANACSDARAGIMGIVWPHFELACQFLRVLFGIHNSVPFSIILEFCKFPLFLLRNCIRSIPLVRTDRKKSYHHECAGNVCLSCNTFVAPGSEIFLKQKNKRFLSPLQTFRVSLAPGKLFVLPSFLCLS